MKRRRRQETREERAARKLERNKDRAAANAAVADAETKAFEQYRGQ